MTNISHAATPAASRAAMIARRPATSGRAERPSDVLARHDREVLRWRHLRTIVDGLLRRAAASNDDATTMGTTHTTPDEQELIHG
jgi:hypothetical protein